MSACVVPRVLLRHVRMWPRPATPQAAACPDTLNAVRPAPWHGCRALLNTDAAARPPPSIAGLARLQRVCFLPGDFFPLEALPTGPWTSSLRQLGASYRILLLSGPLLAAATQLEQLGVLEADSSTEPGEARERFWRWCAEHPPLQQLHIELNYSDAVPTPLLLAINELQGARPALQVLCHTGLAHFPALFEYDV